MIPAKRTTNYAEALRGVLPEYELASRMPQSVMDAPEFKDVPREGRDDFEDAFWRNESGKLYKSIDGNGNVFLITNPRTWERRKRGDSYVHFRPAPRAMGHINDLPKLSGGSQVAPIERAAGIKF